MNSNVVEYRGWYIDIYHFINDDGDWEWIAGIYNNGVCCKIVGSFISEGKVINKAKKYVDKILEESNG